MPTGSVTPGPLLGGGPGEPLVVPLDAESIHSLISDFKRVLSRIELVEEVGDGYVVLRVPRRFGILRLGSRPMRLDMHVYRLENALVVLLGRGADSLVLVVSIADVGEGVHIVVSGGGSGRLSPAAGSLVRGVREAIAGVVEEAWPTVSLSGADDELAAAGVQDAALVFYDSFTPVKNVLVEAAYRVIAALGPGEYLAEIQGMLHEYYYLARLVIRGRSVTGVYAEMDGHSVRGEDALKTAWKPPSHRVRLLAWALGGQRHRVRVNAPQPVYEEGRHAVYRLWPGGRPEYGGLTVSTYIVGDGYEYAVVDPAGPAEWSQAVRGLVGDMEQLRLIVAGDASASTYPLLRELYAASPAQVLAPPYAWAQLAGLLDQPDRVSAAPLTGGRVRLGRSELHVIPASCCGGMLSLYDQASRTLFTGPVLGFLLPPGLPYAGDPVLRRALRAYLRSTLTPQALGRWLKTVQGLEVERLAPRYGPLVEGVERVKSLLGEAAELVAEGEAE